MALFEQPPKSTEPVLREYLSRVNTEISYQIDDSNKITRYTALPDKVFAGRLYYFKNAIPSHTVITAEGFYGYKSTGWVFIA